MKNINMENNKEYQDFKKKYDTKEKIKKAIDEPIEQNLYGKLTSIQEALEYVKNHKYNWIKKYGRIHLLIAIDDLKEEYKKLK